MKNKKHEEKGLEGKIIEDIDTQVCNCHGFRDFSSRYIYFPSLPFALDSYSRRSGERYGFHHSKELWEVTNRIEYGPQEVQTRKRAEYSEIGGGVYDKNLSFYSHTQGRIIQDILINKEELIERIHSLYFNSKKIEKDSGSSYLAFLDHVEGDESIQKEIKFMFQELPNII